jgi:hypothetical protein
MTELTLELDNKACEAINDLMRYYKVNNRAELISKAISVLKMAALVSKTDGELIARKGSNETKIIVK